MVQVAKQMGFVSEGGAYSERPEDLHTAFEQFNKLSKQLAGSYERLKSRVSELTQDLHCETTQRLNELAEKERLAQRLETLLHLLPGGIVVLDARGCISDSNPVADDLLGESLKGKLWREVIGRCFSPKKSDGHEVSTRDGKLISIATRSMDKDGQIILLTNQTETRRLQQELNRHEKLTAMGRMVSALAHQIRTPLSAAVLYAGHLRDGQLSEQQRREFSSKLVNRLNHLEQQVRDMLLFVKGELPLNDRISIDDLRGGLDEAMEVLLLASQSTCVWNINTGLCTLRCNREALISALLNLVNNGIQAVGQKACLLINMKVEQECWLVISVSDKGPGIAPEQLSVVQELFVTTKPHGTGLGLSVVQAVAQAHGGDFILQSQPQFGTQAILKLPLDKLPGSQR